jgi:ABC-type polysaccharide/polyol phosphate export permease
VPEKTITYDAADVGQRALSDVWDGISNYRLWLGFAWHDLRQKYRRSLLGPFWITLSTAATVAALALVYSTIFPTPLAELLPYLAVGLVTWALISSCVTEGCETFNWSERWIRNVPMPVSVHLLRLLARHLIVWAHNCIIVVALLLVYRPAHAADVLLVIPGMALLIANLFWISLSLGLLCARYRDITQIVASAMQIVFFVTPIFWSVKMAAGRAGFVEWNPFYHLIELVRAPLLGGTPQGLSYWIAIGMAIVGLPVALLLYRHARSKLSYWVS